jgi:predicted kinase
MLIVFGGLPGTGKTTVAKALAQTLDAVYLRIDAIEQALRSHEVLRTDVGPLGYVAGYRLAEDNLRIGGLVESSGGRNSGYRQNRSGPGLTGDL